MAIGRGGDGSITGRAGPTRVAATARDGGSTGRAASARAVATVAWAVAAQWSAVAVAAAAAA